MEQNKISRWFVRICATVLSTTLLLGTGASVYASDFQSVSLAQNEDSQSKNQTGNRKTSNAYTLKEIGEIPDNYICHGKLIAKEAVLRAVCNGARGSWVSLAPFMTIEGKEQVDVWECRSLRREQFRHFL